MKIMLLPEDRDYAEYETAKIPVIPTARATRRAVTDVLLWLFGGVMILGLIFSVIGLMLNVILGLIYVGFAVWSLVMHPVLWTCSQFCSR